MGLLEVLLLRWIKGKIKGYIMKRILLGALKSKTIGFAGLLSLLTWLSHNTAVVDAVVPTTWQAFAGYFIAASIALLRVVTNKPLESK